MSRTEPGDSGRGTGPDRVMAQVFQLGKESFVYGLAGAAGGLVGVVALPLLTSALSPSEYALIATATVLVALLSSVSTLGLDVAALRWLNDEEGRKQPDQVVSSWFWTQFAASLAIGAVLGMLAGVIASWLFDEPSGATVLLVAAILIPLQTFRAVASGWYRFRRQPLWAALFLGGGAALSIILMTGAVWFLDSGVVGAMTGQLVAGGVVAIATVVVMGGRLGIGQFSRRLLGPMLRFGLPLMPATVLNWVVASSDRVVLAALGSVSDVGIYSVAIMIMGVMMVPVTAFTTAFPPFAFSIREEPNVKETIASIAAWSGWFFFTAAAGLSVVAPFLVAVLAADEYAAAATAVPYLALGFAVGVLSSVFMTGPMYLKKTSVILASLALTAAVNVILNILLIPVLGMQGAALASMLAMVVRALALYWYSQRLYPISFPVAAIMLSAASAVGVIVVGQFIPAESISGNAARLGLVFLMGLVPFAARMTTVRGLYSRSRRWVVGPRT